MMGMSGWEARRMVERGEEVEGDDDTEDGGRVGKLMAELRGLYSEMEWWWMLAAAEFEVVDNVERSEGCDGKQGQWRCWLVHGVDKERTERGADLRKPGDWRRQGG
jgi:hypothetical protein